jgi:hypothetical protein
MALITSAATGNFNATGTWTGGVVPVAGDEARVSNGHVVTITANATCTLLTNNGTGYFVLNSGLTLTANVTNATGSTQNNPCVRFTSASPASATIVGNLTATGGASNAHAVLNSSTGTLNITGNVTGGSAQTSNGVLNSTTGTINITGNCTGGTSGNCFAVSNTNGQIVVTGNVTGGSATAAVGFPSGISNDTGTVTVAGIVSAGAIASSHGIQNNSTGSVTVVGEVIATNGANGINSTNTSSVVRASGSMTYSANGTLPIMANRFFLNTTPSFARTRFALNGSSTYFDMSGADVAAAGGVATSNVRAGVTYAGLTGTCAVPPAASVSLGVPVDNTTGTAVLTGSAIAVAVWGAATRSITGGTVDTLTNAPTVPSAAAIASQVRTELGTELGRLDQSVSSRLASADYTTPPTTAQISAAVEGSLLNEGDGQAVINAIVGAIGNTNISQVALVAAIRSDLERTGGKIDSIPAAPTAAQNASAVWGASAKIITGGVVDTLTNAPASVTPSDIWSHASRTITGGTVTTLTNAPTVPTAAAIASQVRTELATELAKMDAAVSTRATPANIPTTDIAAIKAKTDSLNVDRVNNTATLSQVGNLLAQANS